MTRRFTSLLLALILASASLPSKAQVGRITFEAPASPAPSASAGVIGASGVTLSLAAAPTLSLTLAPTPVLAAPAAAERLPISAEPVAPIPARRLAVAPVVVLRQTAEKAVTAPDDVGRLFDQAPAAPNFDLLSPVNTPATPMTWRPASALLKPFALATNAVRAARHKRRMNALGPDERVSTEEEGIRESLTKAHDALLDGRLQEALEEVTKAFKGPAANSWYRANPAYQPYQNKGHAYLRFVERAVKRAYERAHARSRDAGLIAEARAAAHAETIIGHEYRATAIQDKDSAHCAHHAMFNAIQAAAGFVHPVSVHRFVERARELLNVNAEMVTKARGAELSALQSKLGLKLGVDVGEGMGPQQIKKWALLLGLGFEARGPPRGDAQWSALLGRGRETLLSLRMFHERFKHGPMERDLKGHDYIELRHAVYLLGAFDSPSRGVRLYMVQDSGSGATDFYTAEELSAVTDEVSIIASASPVSLP